MAFLQKLEKKAVHGENPFDAPGDQRNEGTSNQHVGALLFPNTQGVRDAIANDGQLKGLLDARRQGHEISKGGMEMIREFEVEIGKNIKTSDVHKWLHQQDEKFVRSWSNSLDQLNNAPNQAKLQESGQRLKDYWERRQQVMGELQEAHQRVPPLRIPIDPVIRWAKGWGPQNSKHKGRAMLGLTELEDYVQGVTDTQSSSHEVLHSGPVGNGGLYGEGSILRNRAKDIHMKNGQNDLLERFEKLNNNTLFPRLRGGEVRTPDSLDQRIPNQLIGVYKHFLSEFGNVFNQTAYSSWRNKSEIGKLASKALYGKSDNLQYANKEEKNVRKIFLDNCLKWMEELQAHVEGNPQTGDSSS